jgi:hypothetical protein
MLGVLGPGPITHPSLASYLVRSGKFMLLRTPTLVVQHLQNTWRVPYGSNGPFAGTNPKLHDDVGP